MTGSVLSQAITLFTAPILTRIYLPEDYGVLGIYMSVSAVFGVFATLMYDQTIVITKKDEDASHLVWGVLSLTALISTISLVLILFLKDPIAQLLNAPDAANWFLFIPLSVAFGGLSAVFNTWANRHKKYKRLASTRVGVGIASILISIALGLLIKGPLGLIVALLAHQGAMGLFMGFMALKYDRHLFVPRSKERAKELFAKYLQFPKFSVFSELTNRVTNQMPVYLLSIFTGKQAVGHYNMSNRMLGLPIHFVSAALTEVFRQKASHDYAHRGSCRPIYLQTLRTLALLAIIPFTIIGIFAPDIFAFVFGENWRAAGEYSRPLSILFFFKFITSPLSYIFYIAGKLTEDAVLHIWILVSSAAAMYIGHVVFKDTLAMLYLFSINYALIYLWYIIRGFSFTINPNFVANEDSEHA